MSQTEQSILRTFRSPITADKYVLQHLNLHFPSGSMVGILGSTGSGKTTMVSLIARLYDTNGGKVLVGGHDVKDYDLVSLRDSVAVVLQKNTLFHRDDSKIISVGATPMRRTKKFKKPVTLLR
jgi:ABC-type multidrug transport system fused ATPase/permease subunit